MSSYLPAEVSIREVAPRDGLQIEAPVPLAAKLELIDAIARTGAARVEATSFVSPRAVPSLADAEHVAAALSRWPGIGWSALVASLTGVRRALDVGIRHLNYVVSVSDAHSQANAGRTTAEAVSLIGPIAEMAHAAGGRLEVSVAVAWDCPFYGPTPRERTLAVLSAAVRRGADQLCIADTIGTATPPRVTAMIEAARPPANGLDIGVHFHNTRGTGIACAFAAMQAGVRFLDASIGGLGGCPFAPGASGNIATEELLYALDGGEVRTGMDLDAVLAAAAVARRIVGHELSSSLSRAGGANHARAPRPGWGTPLMLAPTAGQPG